MKRSVRNRLGDLLLEAFQSGEGRIAITWLKLYCDLAARQDRAEYFFADMLRSGRAPSPGASGKAERAFNLLVGPGKLLGIRRARAADISEAARSIQAGDEPLLVEMEADARASFPEVHERARIYANLVERLDQEDVASSPMDPLRRAMGQAALCFNAGLFFEAHEHLEHHWMHQPKGPTKRFLQGIIQISVGFHHARAGNYDGAVNQLTKGQEKTAGFSGDVLGLDCDAFLPKVAAAQKGILARGRQRMVAMPPGEIPRMLLRE